MAQHTTYKINAAPTADQEQVRFHTGSLVSTKVIWPKIQFNPPSSETQFFLLNGPKKIGNIDTGHDVDKCYFTELKFWCSTRLLHRDEPSKEISTKPYYQIKCVCNHAILKMIRVILSRKMKHNY